MAAWVAAERALCAAEASGSLQAVEDSEQAWKVASAALEARVRADGQYPPSRTSTLSE